MKIYVKLLLIQFSILLPGNMVYAQKRDSKKEITFIKWLFQNPETRPYTTPYSRDSSIVYADGLDDSKIAYIKKELLNKDTLEDLDCKKNKVVFSEREKKYIKKELEKMKNRVWPKNIFSNSILISRDTISTLNKKSHLPQFDFFSRYPHGYSFFSRPIFLRNGSLCIIYSGYNCAYSCFDDNLLIFRKEGEGWIELISLVETII
jgi:hypothetical protein